MDYREHEPAPSLRPWLACTWERRGDDGAPVRILPDGCIDIVWTQGRGTQIAGANTTAFLATVSPGAHVVGARLRPGAAPSLLGLRAELVRDERRAIEGVLGEGGARLAAELDGCRNPVAALEAWLQHQAARAHGPDPLVAAAVARLSGHADRVGEVADELWVSERALRRRVTSAVGYGPKRLGRVFCFWRGLRAARASDQVRRGGLYVRHA